MIDAAVFVREARERDFSFYSGVPCSYLGSLDRALRTASGVDAVISANEGDALATCAGAVLAGRGAVAFMQNSGLGNAVNPLASLTWPFRVPVLLLVTLRGDPQGEDEPQHRLMGRITPGLLESLEIPWEFLPAEPEQLGGALERARRTLDKSARPAALLVRRGTFAAAPAEAARARTRARDARDARAAEPAAPARAAGERPTRAEALARIVAATPPERAVVISTTGYTSRELWAQADRPNQLYMVGSMGCASALGLGIALARPELRVVVIDGDGAALMRLGNLATVGAHAGDNLVHVVLDNEAHESTGLQPTVSPGVSFAAIARACGYALALEGDALELLDRVFAAERLSGPRLAQLKIRPGSPANLPRPSLSPEQVRERFSRHLRGREARA
ncbi:MAG TPA: phosphonopyruvate decarboxylase [Myxococcota bacterium]|nr:phosphonopyruvate decarboxylase [Myxococcota bacterium]